MFRVPAWPLPTVVPPLARWVARSPLAVRTTPMTAEPAAVPQPGHPVPALTTSELRDYRCELERVLTTLPGHAPVRGLLQDKLTEVLAEQESRARIAGTSTGDDRPAGSAAGPPARDDQPCPGRAGFVPVSWAPRARPVPRCHVHRSQNGRCSPMTGTPHGALPGQPPRDLAAASRPRSAAAPAAPSGLRSRGRLTAADQGNTGDAERSRRVPRPVPGSPHPRPAWPARSCSSAPRRCWHRK